MTEERDSDIETADPGNTGTETRVPDKEEILKLYEENQNELADIKAMLTDYFEKLTKARESGWVSGSKVRQSLKISKSTLRRYRLMGLITFVSINNTYRYKVS